MHDECFDHHPCFGGYPGPCGSRSKHGKKALSIAEACPQGSQNPPRSSPDDQRGKQDGHPEFAFAVQFGRDRVSFRSKRSLEEIQVVVRQAVTRLNPHCPSCGLPPEIVARHGLAGCRYPCQKNLPRRLLQRHIEVLCKDRTKLCGQDQCCGPSCEYRRENGSSCFGCLGSRDRSRFRKYRHVTGPHHRTCRAGRYLGDTREHGLFLQPAQGASGH